MCTVCAIYDYGKNIPMTDWSKVTLKQFQDLLDAARQFDEATGQPDCEDPSKAKWLTEVKQHVESKE